MKKVFLTLAVFVMAFGNADLFAQRSERLAMIQKQVKEQLRGSRDDSWYAPETATYTEIEGNSTTTFRNTYTYDEYEYCLIEKLVEIQEGNSWRNAEWVTYENDFSGNPLEVLTQEWENGAWENESLVSYTYDNDDLLSEVIVQEWENGDWENVQKMSYNFTGDSYTIITYQWNGGWSVDELYTVTYDFSGNYEILIQYMQGGAWQNDEKQTYTVNANYQLDNVLVQDWVNNAWQNDELETYQYDGELVSAISIQEWKNGAWADEAKVNYTYQNGNATYAIYQEWNGSQWVNANGEIEMFYAENAESEIFEDANEVNVQYVDLTSVAENQVKAFSLFPNPASENIVISGEGFQKAEIYNTVGQKVMETTMSTINVGTLQSGIYMLKVYDANGNAEAQSFVVK